MAFYDNMTYVMKSVLFVITSLLLSLSYAEARAPKLPTAATGLPAEVTYALRDRIHGSGGYWDSDHCNEAYYPYDSVHLVTFVDTQYEYRLNFPYYPHGGYVVMFEMDIFGDARKEKIWPEYKPSVFFVGFFDRTLVAVKIKPDNFVIIHIFHLLSQSF